MKINFIASIVYIYRSNKRAKVLNYLFMREFKFSDGNEIGIIFNLRNPNKPNV